MKSIFKKFIPYTKQKFFTFIHFLRLKIRKIPLKKRIKSLNNKNFTLISNNCNGGVLLHELGLRFNSPFVNLYVNTEDYIKYLQNFDYYNTLEVEFLNDTDKSYPVGRLGDLTVDFVHYKSNSEAKTKWNERTQRINKDNIFVILTEQDDCTFDCLKSFDNLNFENKVVFTCKRYPEIKSSVFVKKYYNNPKGVFMFLDFPNRFSIKRNYDVFDFVSWFNGEKDLNKLMGE
ncbi:MAG: DUF1919 domain-containing protein [Ruminococcaceae bacterium]|nr:DUF1919 domain-containing protein [Oscillospiraceae bacterium]